MKSGFTVRRGGALDRKAQEVDHLSSVQRETIDDLKAHLIVQNVRPDGSVNVVIGKRNEIWLRIDKDGVIIDIRHVY